MTQRPPHRPPPPQVPDLSTYRPYEERQGAAPPIEQRFAPVAPQGAMRPGVPPPGVARRVKVKRKRSWLRIAAWTIGSIGVVTAAGIAALVAFAPVGIIREQVVREVKVRTGRDLAITGRTSLSLYPALGISLGDVALSSPPGMGGAPFVRMRRLDIEVAALPLLSRKISVDRLVMTEPVFDLRVDARGNRSWDFAELALPATIMVAQAGTGQPLPPELQDFLKNSTRPGDPASAAPAGDGKSARNLPMQDIALGDVRIDNGTVRYRDERAGVAEEIRAINARVSAKSLSTPLEARGALTLRGDKMDFEGRIGSPRALLEARPSRVALAVTSPKATARFDGSLVTAKSAQLDGNVKLDTRSLRTLAGWIGATLPTASGFGPLSLEGELKTGATWVSLNNAKVQLDAISGTGNVNVDMVSGKPSVKAALRLGQVDLNPYLAPAGERASGTAPASGQPIPAQPASVPPAARPAPQVKGYTKRTGWSETPIDISGLGALDADVKLSLAGMIYEEIKLGASQATIVLRNRVLRTTIDDVRLYGGQGRGVINLEPSGQAAAVSVNLSVDGVTALPLLRDAADFEWVDGRGRIQLAVSGVGGHQRAIMESLNGKADFGFTDGAIVGFNLPGMIRNLQQGKLSGFNRTPTERTDFSEAGASFQIRNGVAETKDLRAMSPLVRLTGAGNVNLGQRQIDTTLRPRLVGSLTGQGGAAAGELAGIELPVRVRGSWEKPQISADMESLLKNPNQAVEAVRELGKQIQQGKGGAALNNLLEQFRKR